MKIYTKYMVIIILIPIELLSVFILSNFSLENILALWGGVYAVRFYRQFFDFERMPSIYNTPGLNISGVINDPAHIEPRTEELIEAERHSGAALKNIEMKLIYLTLAIAHFGICTYLTKFSS